MNFRNAVLIRHSRNSLVKIFTLQSRDAREATRSAFIPSTATVLVREAWPAMIVTCPFFTPSSSASRRMHSSFAFPSTGGAVIRSFSASSWMPAISLRDARGTTRMRKTTPVAVSRIDMGDPAIAAHRK